MDLAKKRKADDLTTNGITATDEATTATIIPQDLTGEDAVKLLAAFTKDQLVPILSTAILQYPDILAAVRSLADSDSSQRKLFIRGLGWETTTDKLRSVFSAYGPIDEAIVITDKNTGKSKGYGFVTFKHIDSAVIALKQPNKQIDGRITVTQLAAAGNSNNSLASSGSDLSARKIYVGNVPFEISSERLLSHFMMYGEIDEGPLGFDKQTGKVKGFAFFVYKTEEGARKALVDPVKVIDGHQLVCKMAIDNKKAKTPQVQQGGNVGPMSGGMGVGMPGEDNRMGMGGMPGANYGAGGFGFGSGGPQQQGMMNVNPGFGGYGMGGQYGSAGGGGTNMYRMPPSTMGMGMQQPVAGGYAADASSYGLAQAYPNQVAPQQQGGAPRGPLGAGMYPSQMPPYY